MDILTAQELASIETAPNRLTNRSPSTPLPVRAPVGALAGGLLAAVCGIMAGHRQAPWAPAPPASTGTAAHTTLASPPAEPALAPLNLATYVNRQPEDGLVGWSGGLLDKTAEPASRPCPRAAAQAAGPAVEHASVGPSFGAFKGWGGQLRTAADQTGFARVSFVSERWKTGGWAMVMGAKGIAALEESRRREREARELRAELAEKIAKERVSVHQRMRERGRLRGLGDGLAANIEATAATAAVAKGVGVSDVRVQSVEGGRAKMEVSFSDGSTAQLETIDPLVLDLGGQGLRTSDRWVRFDLAGDGRIGRVHDLASNMGVLVFDSNRDGVSGANGREVFGDRTDLDGDGRPDGFRDGYEALEGLARMARREGILKREPSETLGASELAALGKAYGLGVRRGSFGAKTVRLEEAGVREIVLSASAAERRRNFDGQGSDLLRRSEARFVRADGTAGAIADLFLGYERPRFEQLALAR